MNNITLAHIGGDLVLIGGVAFYFHRKTATLTEEISTLKKENKLLSDAIIELQENLQQLADAFMQSQGGVPMQAPRAQSQVPPQRRQPVPQKAPQRTAQPAAQGMMDMMQGLMQQPPPLQQPTLRKPKRVAKPRKQDPEDSGVETLDDRELDKELDNEYQELEKQRGNCEGDTCAMPN